MSGGSIFTNFPNIRPGGLVPDPNRRQFQSDISVGRAPRYYTAPPSDASRALYDSLQHSWHERNGRFTTTVKATLTRNLFWAICPRTELLPYFMMDGDKWLNRTLGEWLVRDDLESSVPWSLRDHQRRIKAKRKEAPEPRPGRVCGKTLHRYDRTYTCKTCSLDGSCILCVDCFRASDHEGHEVLFGQSYTFSAACDCGDPTGWKDNGHLGCYYHPPLPAGTEPPERKLFVTDRQDIPPELIQAITETVTICIEFIIETLQHSLLQSDFGKLPKNEEEMRKLPTQTGQPQAERGKGPWSVVLWTDDKHVVKEVTRQIRDAVACKWDHAERLTKEAEHIGRKTIITSPNPIQAFHVANMLQQIDLGVTLRSAYDVFREETIALIMIWLTDMCQTSIGGDEDLFLRIVFKVLNEPRFATAPNGESATDGYPGTPLSPDLKELEYPPWGRYRRIDWLMQLDTKMWKRAKWQWREIYSWLYALGWETRCELAGRFAFNYVRLFEHYIYQDREIDSNLMYCIAYMVFGNGPACAYATKQENLFNLVLDVAYAFYTNQITLGRLTIPPQDVIRTVDRKEVEDSPAFRGKKGITVFGHVRSLLRHEEMQRIVASDTAMFLKVAKFLNMFVGMQTQAKELKSHIEFEVDWPRTFAHLSELAKTSRELGETLKYATPQALLSNISAVAAGIFADLTLQSDTLNPEKYKPPKFMLLQDVLIPGQKIEVLSVDTIHMEGFSFHHYLNLLFAESVKHLRTLDWKDGKYEGKSPQEVFDKLCLAPLGVDPELLKLVVFEWSFQKIAILAHIKADLWRRNGVGMRGQLHHYREVGVREATVDLEFWAIQIALCVCNPLNPLRLFGTLVNRWGLTSFFTDDVLSPHQWSHELLDPKQRVVLAEDFMMLCIYLVCDMSTPNGWSQEQLTRHTLIHILALNTMGYSEILKKMPERSTETSFLHILAEIADFRQPTDTVLGAYTLKPEFLDQVDPYWRHYTRNDQRVVIDKILARKKKLHPEIEDPFIQPHPLNPPGLDSPFHNVIDWAKGDIVAHIVHYAIAHCMPIADPVNWAGVPFLRSNEGMPQLDLLLDLTLHLAMIALQANAERFAMASVDLVEGSNAMSIFQNLWFMQTNENFKGWKPRVDHIMKKIIEQLPQAYTQDYFKQQEGLAEAMAKEPVVPKPDLKGAAAARQKAIMQEFAKKQADFAAFMDVEDEEDEDVAETAEVTSYGQCIVCQDDVTPKNTGGMLALLQPSRMLREVVVDRDWFEESLAAPVSLDRNTRYHRFGHGTTGEPATTDAYPAANCRFGVYMSACSHLMHETCVITYFDATRLRHAHQVQRHQPENLVRMEYLCPLCKSLGNVLIPLDPTPTPLRPYIHPRVLKGGSLPSVSEKIRLVSNECLLQVKESAKIWDHHVETGELNVWFADTNFAIQTMDAAYRKSVKPNARMIERVRSLMRPLSEQSQRLRHKKTYMYLPDDVVAYTVSICEIAQRGFQTPGMSIAEQVPENSMKLIKQLIGHLQLELDVFFGPKFDRTPLRVGIFARLLPDWFRASSLPSPLLMRNPLALVVEAAAIAPDLLHSVISMAYYAELTRAMLGLSMWIRRCHATRARPQPRTYPDEDPQINDVFDLFEDFRPIMQSALKTHAGGFTDTDGLLNLVSDNQLAKLLYSHTLPFLRRAAILFHAVAGQYPNPEPVEDLSSMGEYKRLLCLLHIPAPMEALGNPNSTESTMVSRWLTSWSLQGRMVPPTEYPGTYELLRLPKRWEDIMIQYAETKCDKCGSKPNFPALCLYCGAFLCLGGDCCKESEQGECNIHMRDCGGATGMFVDIKRWLLVIMYAGSGSFGHMPYLDSHGELDISMRRGHRLFMHIGRMDEVRKSTWLQHTIPHLTARKLEVASDGGGWGTL